MDIKAALSEGQNGVRATQGCFIKIKIKVYYIDASRGLKLLMDKLRTGPNGKTILTARQSFPRILELTKVAESTYKS
jgi:hypothetical protein